MKFLGNVSFENFTILSIVSVILSSAPLFKFSLGLFSLSIFPFSFHRSVLYGYSQMTQYTI